MTEAVVTSCSESRFPGYEECWVSFKDKQHRSRSKVPIGEVYLNNASNREILERIKESENAIEMINKEICGLKESLERYKPGANQDQKREALL